jgi:hypothetical protein
VCCADFYFLSALPPFLFIHLAMASRSGLSVASSSPVLPVPPPSTASWSFVHLRQQRLVSALGEAEKRCQLVCDKLERLGWQNPNKRGPNMEGAEWVSLAKRQQALLQNICAARERAKVASHRLGLTSAPHAESVALPQLARRVPSHFNNQQLRALLQEETVQEHVAPMYPLTKLLALVVVRDLHRFTSSGAIRCTDESAVLSNKAGAAATAAVAASVGSCSVASATVAAVFSPSHSIAASSSPATVSPSVPSVNLAHLTLEQLLQRLLWALCRTKLTAIQTAHLLREGMQLCKLSLNLDKDSRILMNEEPYLLSSSDAASLPDNVAPSAALTASCAAFHAKQSRSWFSSGVSPFANYHFSKPPAALKEAQRIPCPRCRRPCSLYCAFCLVTTLPEHLRIPEVRLPLQVDM